MKIEKRVTIKDLAAACGVSTATISRVLNHLPGGYSAQTEEMILRTAKDMGYVPNQMARSLITHKTKLVAVLCPDIHYNFFQDFYTGLEKYMNSRGYRLLLCSTQGEQAQESLFIRELSNGLVDGMILSTLNKEQSNQEILDLANRGFPMLLLEKYAEELQSLYQLQVENVRSGEMAVQYLHQRGHRRIAFIGDKDAPNARLRYQGYCKGLEEYGLSVDPDLVKNGGYSFQGGYDAMEELLETAKFTAVIPANDLMTIGACKAIIKSGRRIPEDISVLGLDKTMMTSSYEPPIVAVDFKAEHIGKVAGEYMVKLIEGKSISQRIYVQESQMSKGRSVRSLIK